MEVVTYFLALLLGMNVLEYTLELLLNSDKLLKYLPMALFKEHT